MNKKLVVYFSASGITARLAKKLAEASDADVYEIQPEVLYTNADLDWQDETSRSTVEMNDPSSRPAIADKNANIAAYNIIFVGFPIWWHKAPTIINTFLESYDFSGKTIVAFATSGSEGFGQTMEWLKPSVTDASTLIEGKLLNGNPAKEVLSSWVDSLNLL